MRHEPCTPVRDLEHPVKLVGTHALLAGTEQVIGKQPLAQGDVAVLEYRSHRDGELLTAPAALPDAFADVFALAAFLGGLRLKLIGVVYFTAVRADRAIWPTNRF